jgi:hypothetical protein
MTEPRKKAGTRKRKPKIDVRAATEWATLQYDPCVDRNDAGIVQNVDFDRATSPCPPGGKQLLDMAVNNRVSFNNFLLKVLGSDVEEDDEMVKQERKSIEEMTELLIRFQERKK